MADELIRRNDAIEFFQRYYGGVQDAVIAVRMLNALDTIDAVEVVRCKECVCCMEFTDDAKEVENAYGKCYMRLMNSEDTQYQCIQADDFCSYGKRKDGDE